jgi:hypothetical protein
MPRIRTVKPEFWTSEQVMELSATARLAFIGMWNFCDDGGVHVASLKTLKAEIFPADDIATEDIRRMIDELVANGLVLEYTAEGREFWKVTGWEKHQKIDRPNPKHPQPGADASPSVRRPSAPGRESSRVDGSGRDAAAPRRTRKRDRKAGRSAASKPDAAPPPDHTSDPPHLGVAVIAAFDAARAGVFGADQARPHPHPTDLGAAKAMLEGGADLETCRFVFRATFERQKAAGQRPAAMLRYMRDPVADAVAGGAADPLAIPEKYRRSPMGARLGNPADVQRASRIESYRRAVAEGRAPFWLDEWGDPPGGDEGTEAGE